MHDVYSLHIFTVSRVTRPAKSQEILTHQDRGSLKNFTSCGPKRNLKNNGFILSRFGIIQAATADLSQLYKYLIYIDDFKTRFLRVLTHSTVVQHL
jgi:hypothetical protein